ncbi:MAG: CapA family protein [Gemmatimonadales bacterium]
MRPSAGHTALVLVVTVSACSKAPPPPQPSPQPSAERGDTLALPPSPLIEPSPVPLPPPPATVRLAFVGDINLGTSTLPDGVPPDSGRGLLKKARPSLVGDLVVGNFEGVLADTGTSVKCLMKVTRPRARGHRPSGQPAETLVTRPNCYAFRTPTWLAPRLIEAGFTHLNLANNHANDLGSAGRASTERILDSLGIGLYGPLGRIVIDTVKRGDSLTTVGLIGFTTYPFAYDLLDIERSAAVVDSLRPLVDLLLVTFHGGAEGAKAVHTGEAAESLGAEPRGDLRRWARAVIDAGADAVIGHGPHVLRGMEFYRGRLIAYSLGNFVTYRGFNLSGALGVTGVLQLEFAGRGPLRRARLAPMLQLPQNGPAPDPERQAVRLVRQLSAEDFGATAAVINESGEIWDPRRPATSATP